MQHLRTQNWVAVALDLIVVVVGIFIAFQIDRLYENRRARFGEETLLRSLSEDFQLNRQDLEAAIAINDSIIEAALKLRDQGRNATSDLSVADLNKLVVTIARLPSFESTRRAFDNLTSSGELDRIRNIELRQQLTEFYAYVQLVDVIQATQEQQWVTIFQPYIIENLDYAATTFMWNESPGGNPEMAAALEPLIFADSILDVLRTREFQNIVTAEWETAADMKERHAELLKRVIRIQELIALELE